ncbi:P-loop ATPase, Sll1717 family [Clostridium hydrogenum]|uniref:P-loop ATPase, Sll1717 family n=1 Tax=Clostridium hydrogenum TaxID=2855764 RepID=UPI001F2608F3|nr:hypothetical protein [Clostridium hydrogenum]
MLELLCTSILTFTIFSVDEEEIYQEIRNEINNNNYYVLIDNLDEPWKNSTQMNSWLRGLMLSMRQLKRDYSNLKVITFLRDDIFDIIARGSDIFDSKDELLRIKWKDDQNYLLRKILAYRIANYYGETLPGSSYEIDKQISKLFVIKLKYTSSGKIRNKERHTLAYMIERTFSRPRELLQFARLILEKNPSNNLPITPDIIYSAEKEYSNWKVIDLAGEYSKTYENIDKFILSFSGLHILYNWKFSFNDIDKHYKTLDDGSKVYNKVSKHYLTTSETVELLYIAGFFRKIRRIGQYSIKYITSVDERDIDIQRSTFDVHPAFRKKLYNNA